MNKILYCRRQKGDCWNCHYADACPRYQDTGLETPVLDEHDNIVGYAMPTDPSFGEDGVKVD